MHNYQYDVESALVRPWNSASDVEWFRDALGRDTAVTQLLNGSTRRIGYTYEPGMWLRASLRDDESGVHSYAYDQEDRLATIVDPESQTTSYDYDLAGRVLERVQGNGQIKTYAYNGPSLASITATHGGATLWSAAYSNDDLGLPDGVTYHDGSGASCRRSA